MGWNRSSESGGANTPGSPHVGQPKFALRSKGDGTARGKSLRPRWLRGAVAAVIVVVGAGIAWWLLAPSSERPTSNVKPQTSKPSLIKEATPDVPKGGSNETFSASAETNAVALKPGLPATWMGKKVVDGSIVTNDSGVIKMRVKTSDGNWYREVKHVKPWFNFSSDQVLVNYLSAKPGVDAPPMPMGPNMDREFKESLKEKIEIKDDDKPEVKAMKLAVIEAREYIKDEMEKGRSFEEVIRDHIEMAESNNKIYNDALREYQSIVNKGDEEGARKYRIAMDAAFQQMGMKGFEPAGAGARDRQEVQQQEENRK